MPFRLGKSDTEAFRPHEIGLKDHLGIYAGKPKVFSASRDK
jgi:hypothetical protein